MLHHGSHLHALNPNKMRPCKFGLAIRLFWNDRPHMLKRRLIQVLSFSLELSDQNPFWPDASSENDQIWINHFLSVWAL